MRVCGSGWGGLLLALCSSGCAGTGSVYVEDGHDSADYSDIEPRDPPMPVHVDCQFLRNGEPHPEVNGVLCSEVVRVLQNTRTLAPAGRGTAATLKVTVDDRADISRAFNGGLITGLTQGLIGVETRDDYHFTYSLLKVQSKPQTGLYRHAMITVAGNVPTPSSGRPLTADDAFTVIVKQSVLAFLADVQSSPSGEAGMFVHDGSVR